MSTRDLRASRRNAAAKVDRAVSPLHSALFRCEPVKIGCNVRSWWRVLRFHFRGFVVPEQLPKVFNEGDENHHGRPRHSYEEEHHNHVDQYFAYRVHVGSILPKAVAIGKGTIKGS